MVFKFPSNPSLSVFLYKQLIVNELVLGWRAGLYIRGMVVQAYFFSEGLNVCQFIPFENLACSTLLCTLALLN